MNSKILIASGVIVVTSLLLLNLIFSKSGAELAIQDIEKYKSSKIIKDLLNNRKFSPPYEDISPLIQLAKTCKEEFFNQYPLHAQYAQINVKQEALALANSSVNGMLSGVIESSGGLVSLSDYVTQDVIYLYNIRNRSVGVAEENAKKLYNEFERSSQVKKASKFMKPIQDKKQFEKLTEKEKVELKVTVMCGLNDMYYTALGGVEYSNSADVYPTVKRLLHSKTMNSLKSFMGNN